MSFPTNRSRRSFLRSTTAAGVAIGFGDLAFVSKIRPASAEEMQMVPSAVEFDSGIEPLVQLLENTPREDLIETFAKKVNDGTSYREILAALLLAGIRNIPPRPDVGWKFHAVLCINSAHLASLESPPQDRWLPIFYALDFFKGQQMYDERESTWSLSQVDEPSIPPAHRCRAAFDKAMQTWDDEAADVATAALVRHAGATEVFERFAYYGMRDFRNIGHKEIFMANSWRTLQCIGWRNAEPVMRSLTYALLNHHDEPNPSTNDLDADKPWRNSLELADTIRKDWVHGKLQDAATIELLATMRDAPWREANAKVVELLNRGISPQSVWDSLFCGAAELLMRQPGIYALHAVTATNAMAFAYRTTGSDHTRRMLMLQNAAFLPQFRDYLRTVADLREARIDELKADGANEKMSDLLPSVFDLVGVDKDRAAAKALAFFDNNGRPEEFMDVARKLIFLKTQNSHHYKFSSAALEDYYNVSPTWRNRFLATSVYYLRGTGARDNALVKRTRAALKA